MLRAAITARSELGLSAKSIMDSGQLVSDDIMIALVQERLAQADCQNGFLLDGFPRTIPQAQAMQEAGIDIDCIIEIAVDDNEIVRRISGRRIHPASGRVYHVDTHPPQHDGVDDETGEALIFRDDDHEDIIRKRLEVYHLQTEPLIDYYKNWEKIKPYTAPRFHPISGVGTEATIYQRILDAIAIREKS